MNTGRQTLNERIFGPDLRDLMALLGVPLYEFQRIHDGGELWDWCKSHDTLNSLPDALRRIGHTELAATLPIDPSFAQAQRKDSIPRNLVQETLGYIERTGLLERARAIVLGDSDTIGLYALQGMGGVGKTVLASAIAEDSAVQSHFDSILWANLGKAPGEEHIKGELKRWYTDLGLTYQNRNTIGDLQSGLRACFKQRRCLLILDNVWEPETLACFRIGDAVLLYTSRIAHLAGLDATGIFVDVLTAEEGCQLIANLSSRLSARLQQAWGRADAQLHVLKRVGFHPLAVVLAVGSRLTPEAFLKEFDHAEPGHEDDSDTRTRINRVLFVSVEQLGQQQHFFQALSIFPQGQVVPYEAACRLWSGFGLPASRQHRFFRKLNDHHLIAANEQLTFFTLHDLLFDLVKQRLGNAVPAHDALLAAYRPPSGRWHDAADDGYLYGHLAYHLAAAERWDELRGLFADDAWMQVRVPQSDWTYDGYLADLEVAWQRAEVEAQQQIDADENFTAIVDCVRYALIRSSVNSLSANYEPALVAQAVAIALDVWSPERALSITQRIPGLQSKGSMATALLGVVNAEGSAGAALGEVRCELQKLALDGARAITNEKDRIEALAALAPQLTEPAQSTALAEALAAACAITNDSARGEALAALAPHLAGHPDHLAEILTAAQAITYERYRSEVLAALAPHLAGHPDHLAEILTAAQAITYERYRSEVLAALAPHLAGHPDHLAEALAAAQAITDDFARRKVLTALAPHLAGDPDHLAEALGAARTITDKYARSTALAALAPQLTEPARSTTLDEALITARAITSGIYRGMALAALAPQLTEPAQSTALADALTTARAITFEFNRSPVLAVLAPHLAGHPDHLAEALTAACTMTNDVSRSEVLTALAPHLAGHPDHLAEALTAARAITHERYRSETLAALAPHLAGHPDHLAEALTAARAITHERYRSETLAALAPHLAGHPDHLAEALTAARAITHERYRIEVFATLIPHLAGHPDHLAEAFTAARAITHESYRIEVLATLIPQLTEPVRSTALAEALTAARVLDFEDDRSKALAALAPYLAEDPDRLAEALTAAHTITDEYARSNALAVLAPQLTEPACSTVLAEALTAARAITDEYVRSNALAVLAPQLTEPARSTVLAEALTAARAIAPTALTVLIYNHDRSNALAALVPHLTEPVRSTTLAEALTVARVLYFEHDRSEALAALAPYLAEDPDRLAEALTAARAITDEKSRSNALAVLAPQLTEQARSTVLTEALTAARAITDEKSRSNALAVLAPQLTEQARSTVLTEALTAARAITDEKSRSNALAVLAPQLTEQARSTVLTEALTAARAITDEKSRSNALAVLIPQLTEPARSTVLAEALTAARAITHEKSRSNTLVALNAYAIEAEQTATICRLVRTDLLAILRIAAEGQRYSVLWGCSSARGLEPPFIAPPTLAAIARAIIDVCRDWRWL